MSSARPGHGELIILSGSSGTGKTSMIQRMMASGLVDTERLVFSVSHTTRQPRRGEVDGCDYHFVERAEFESMAESEAFLEWAVVHRELKGTARSEVLPRLEKGLDVLLDIDVQGAQQVMASYPRAVSVFIMPPSYEALEGRLTGRGLDEPEQIRGRLDVSLWEIECYSRYQYVIINDDLDRASQVLAAIIVEKRHRLDRMSEAVGEILAGFPRRGACSDGGEEE